MIKRLLCRLAFLASASAIGFADTPSDNARVASALRLVDAWLDAQIAYEDIPGVSVAIVHDQQLVWTRGFGFADREKRIPAAPDTIYSVCSISKLFTSVAVMQLRDRGLVRLDEPIDAYLPWLTIKRTYPASSPITLANILTHSSGLPREADFPYWTGPPHAFPQRDEVISKLAAQETLYPAETFYQYSNLGLMLAGEVVGARSGEPYATYVQKKVLEPLGMKDTSPDIPERHPRMATGYTAPSRDRTRLPVGFFQVRGMSAAAGFASTVEDLGRFASWTFRLPGSTRPEVLSANTLREMQRVHWLNDNWMSGYGLGFAISRRDDKTFVGHGGNCPGFRSDLTMSPKDKVAVVVLMNAQGVSPGTYGREIFDVVAPAIAKSREASDKDEKPDPTLDRYVGRYTHPLGSERQVLVMDGQLVMLSLPTDSPRRGLMKLKHLDGHTFRRVRPDGDELGEAVVFETGADGSVVRFRHENNYSVRMK